MGEDSVVSDKCLRLEDTLLGKEKSTNRVLEDGASRSSCAKLMTSDKVESFSEEHEKNSHHIYKNAEDSTKKPSAETTVASGYRADEIKETNDTWNSQHGKRSESPSETSPIKGSIRTGLYEWDNDFEDIRSEDCVLSLDSGPVLEMKDEDLKNRLENLNEAIEEDIMQSVLRPSNCRTYCRANKAKSSQGASSFDKLMDGTSQASAKANSESSKDGLNQAKKGSVSCGTSFRGTVGRTRDYTVLHPSCLSVCNVTIQDTMERSMDEFTASTPADLGEAGRLRKKADIATSKTTTRFRPSNTKSKKDVKLEFLVLKIMMIQEVMKEVLGVLITKLSILALMISVKVKMMKMMTVKWKERQAKKELKQLHHPPCSLLQKAMIIPRTVSLVLIMQKTWILQRTCLVCLKV